jgi:hypothetical protein
MESRYRTVRCSAFAADCADAALAQQAMIKSNRAILVTASPLEMLSETGIVP